MKLLLLALASLPALWAQPALGPVKLDDFSSGNRTNNAPPAKLWSVYTGEDPNQSLSFVNGAAHVVGDPSTGCGATGCGLYWQFIEGTYDQASGFAKAWVQSGTFDTGNTNRMRFKVKCNKTVRGNADAIGHSLGYIGTYTKNPSDTNPANQGDHWYHTLSGDTYANHWTLVEINRHPQHKVGTPGDPGNNPSIGQNSINYFDGLTRWYFDSTNAAVADGGADAWSGVACDFDDYYFDTVTNSPDDKVSNVMANYDGSAYHVSFNSMPNVNETYAFRYSTSSMKTNGFNSGTDGGTLHTTQNDYTFVVWTSPNIAYSGTGMYFAIQPTTTSTLCAAGCFSEVFLPALDNTSGTPGLSLSPGSVNFGNLNINSTSSAQALTLTNTGVSAATVSSIAISGTNASDFSPSDNCSRSAGGLAAGATCTINVTFRPPTTGARSATITVTDTPDSLTASSTLTGNGVDPTAVRIVQTGSCGPQSWPGTCTITATTAGNLIAVSFAAYSGSTSPVLSTITDNATGGSNTYGGISAARSINSAGGQASWNEIWYATNIRAGATTLTITPSVTQTGDVQVWEIANVSTVNAAGALSSQAATTTPVSPALTTTAAKTAIVAIMHPAATAGGSTGVAAPWIDASLNDNMAWAHILPTATGSYTAQWATASTVYASSAVAFSPVSASVPTASAQGVRLSNATLR